MSNQNAAIQINFKTKKDADSFIGRLSKYVDKRKQLISQL